MKWILLILASSILSSCSVMMASKVEGIEMESILAAETRDQLLDLGALPIESDENSETYRILEKRGSIARAWMHGLLDVGTAFLWEFAGTPIESALKQEKSYCVKVHFNEEGQIDKMELQ